MLFERRYLKAGPPPRSQTAAPGHDRDSSGWVHVLLSAHHRGAPISM